MSCCDLGVAHLPISHVMSCCDLGVMVQALAGSGLPVASVATVRQWTVTPECRLLLICIHLGFHLANVHSPPGVSQSHHVLTPGVPVRANNSRAQTRGDQAGVSCRVSEWLTCCIGLGVCQCVADVLHWIGCVSVRG